jgi:hypothetical protein
MRVGQNAVKVSVAKFRVGQPVRISKGKLKFAKDGEQNYTNEISKIIKFAHKTQRPVYELDDLVGQQIVGQFYAEELSPVYITKCTT